MIIEHIAVLNKAARPRPNHVHVLRLVAIEAIGRRVYQLEHDHQREKNRSRHKLL